MGLKLVDNGVRNGGVQVLVYLLLWVDVFDLVVAQILACELHLDQAYLIKLIEPVIVVLPQRNLY